MHANSPSPPARATHAVGNGLQIPITSGVGSGQTLLSAFDDALQDAGAENYNLIVLSSVIPPAAEVVVVTRHHAPPEEFGHRLYCVKAEMRSEEPGAVIAAGLGWFQLTNNAGCFVEHETMAKHISPAELEERLRTQIHASLRDLAARRGPEFVAAPIRTHIVSAQVEARPTCVLALAIYRAEGWDVL